MAKSVFDPKFQIEDIDSKIVVALERISEAFRVGLWSESKQNGLSPIQIQLLLFIHFHKAQLCKVSYLAQEFNMTKATISDAVRVLEKKELLKRIPSVEDKRSHSLQITSKGKAIAKKAAGFANMIQQPLQNMEATQKEALLGSLFDLIHNLQKNEVITVQRMCTTCRFFNASKEGEPAYCQFLKVNLPTEALRVDCPEHEAK